MLAGPCYKGLTTTWTLFTCSHRLFSLTVAFRFSGYYSRLAANTITLFICQSLIENRWDSLGIGIAFTTAFCAYDISSKIDY